MLRTSVPPETLASAARRALLDVDRNVAIPRIETMDKIVALSVADRRFQLSLMVAFGGAAALLAALGVYGVVIVFHRPARTRDGIRIALGARPADIHRLVIAEGLVPVGAGLPDRAGTFIYTIGRAIAGVLFDVRPR